MTEPDDDVERAAIRGLEREEQSAELYDLATARAKQRPAIFRVMGSAEIFAPLAEPTYVVGGVLRAASLMLLGGYGSSLKTWLAADLLVAIALGEQWLGRFSCAPGSSLFLDYESGDYELRRRLQSLARGRGREAVDNLSIACMPAGYLGEKRFHAELTALARGHSLIALDSLRAASPGADENESSIRRGLDELRRCSEATGCAFCVLVHSKKRGGQEGGDSREQLRGSSAIFDAADAVLTSDKADDGFELSQSKARHGKAIDPCRVELVEEHGAVCVVAKDVEQGSPKNENFEALVDRTRKAIRQIPDMGTVAVRAAVGGRKERVDGAVELLLARGEVRDLGANGAHRYRIYAAP